MAKKQKTQVVTEKVTQVAEQPKETMVMETPKPKKDKWEIKNRIYKLKGNKKPLSRSIKSADIF